MKSIFLVFGVILAAVCASGCEEGWEPFNDHCYSVENEPTLSFGAAQAYCEGMDAYLVKIDDWLENTFIADLWGYSKDEKEEYALIGFTDEEKEGEFKWIDGTFGSFTKWEKGEPNDSGEQDCVILSASGEWDDFQCDRKFSFICEK